MSLKHKVSKILGIFFIIIYFNTSNIFALSNEEPYIPFEHENKKVLVLSLDSSYDGYVQYQILYNRCDTMGDEWSIFKGENTINGWTYPSNNTVDYIYDISKMPLDAVKFAIRAKRSGYTGKNKSENGNYDTQKIVFLNSCNYARNIFAYRFEISSDDYSLEEHLAKKSFEELKIDIENNYKSKETISSFENRNNIHELLYTYMLDENNRKDVYRRMLELNGGENNSCVYFASEALRRIEVNIPIRICNTGSIYYKNYQKEYSLTRTLKKRGWSVSKDFRKLQPGDIVFTTPVGGGEGKPTHAYIFMGWVDDEYKYAFICDNQSSEYGNNYHIRNIRFPTKDKEAFYYFMYLKN